MVLNCLTKRCMRSGIFNFWLWVIVFLMLVGVPLVKSSALVNSFTLAKYFVVVFLVGWLTIAWGWQWSRVKIPRLPTEILLFGLWVGLSSWLSIDWLASILGNYGYYTDSVIWFLALGWVFVSVRGLGREKQSLLLVAMVATAVVVAMSGIREYVLISQNVLAGDRIGGTIGQPNRLAFYLLAVLPLTWGLKQKGQRVMKWVFLISFWTILVALLLTLSRTAYITLLAAVILLLLDKFRKLDKKKEGLFTNFVELRRGLVKQVKRSGKLFWVTNVLAMIFVIMVAGPMIGKRITSIQVAKTVEESGYLRLLEMESAINVWLEAPGYRKVFGRGLSTMKYVYPKYKSGEWNKSPEWWRQTTKIRNQYLSFLNELGLVGLVIFLWILVKPVKVWWSPASKDEEKTVALALILIGVNGLFYYFTLSVWLVFFVLLAILHNKKFKAQVRRSTIGSAVGFGLIIAGVFTLPISLRLVWADSLAEIGKVDSLQTAVEMNPWEANYRQRVARKFRLQAEAFAKDGRSKEAEISFETALSWNEEALKLNANDLGLVQTHQWIFYKAGVLVDKKHHDDALRWAQKAVELGPTDPRSWDNLGLVNLDLGRLDEARRQFKTAMQLKSDYVGAYLHLGEALKQQGKIDEAISMYEQAVEIAPGFEVAKQELEKALRLWKKLILDTRWTVSLSWT